VSGDNPVGAQQKMHKLQARSTPSSSTSSKYLHESCTVVIAAHSHSSDRPLVHVIAGASRRARGGRETLVDSGREGEEEEEEEEEEDDDRR
jgi:hypothetical protein